MGICTLRLLLKQHRLVLDVLLNQVAEILGILWAKGAPEIRKTRCG